jgi:myosin heavy subunit
VNVKRVANLLGVSPKNLVEALTQRTIFAHGETVSRVVYYRLQLEIVFL